MKNLHWLLSYTPRDDAPHPSGRWKKVLNFLLFFSFAGFTIFGTSRASSVLAKKARIRDPFFLPVREKKDHIEHKEPSLRLVGIVKSGAKIGALIKNHKRVGIVFKGGLFDGYTVEQISQKDVVLVKGKKSKTLALE